MADLADLHDGWISVPGTNDPLSYYLCYVHDGMRVSHTRHPDNRSVVLDLLGGPAAQPGWDEEGIQARMTPLGLRRLAAELLVMADECERAAI